MIGYSSFRNIVKDNCENFCNLCCSTHIIDKVLITNPEETNTPRPIRIIRMEAEL